MKKYTTYCVVSLLIFSLFGCFKPKPVRDSINNSDTSVIQKLTETKKNFLNFVVLPDSFDQDLIQSSKIDNNVLYIVTTPPEKQGEDSPAATNFFAFDLKSRKLLWTHQYLHSEMILDPERGMSIETNRIYMMVSEMKRGTNKIKPTSYIRNLYCFSTENGKVIFKTPITSTTDAYLYQDYLIVGSQINYEKGKTNEFGDTWLYGDFGFNILNKTTGKLLYHYPLDSKWIGSPIFYNDFCVIVTDDRSVYFFDLKQQKLITKYSNKTMDRDPYPSVSSPVLYKNLVFSIKDPSFELVAYNIETGKIVWRKNDYLVKDEKLSIFYMQPFIYNNSLVCFTNCCQNSLLWISPETGELQRISRMTYPGYPDLVISSDAQPTVIGNQLFLIDSYAKFPDLPIVPDKTWEYPKTLFCYNLDDLNLQYITEIHPNDYHANTVQLSSDNDFVIETGNCLYLIDKNTGQYKDFLFFDGFNVISKFTEIISWKEK